MENNLRKEMQAYSNERIINNIKQKEFFSNESVIVACEIAKQRNLLTDDQIGQYVKLSDLKQEAKRLIDQGYDQQSVESALGQKYNVNANQAKTAVNSGAQESFRNKNSAGAGAGIVTGLIIVFFIIRMILRIAANN